jgi:hypothetical protein
MPEPPQTLQAFVSMILPTKSRFCALAPVVSWLCSRFSHVSHLPVGLTVFGLAPSIHQRDDRPWKTLTSLQMHARLQWSTFQRDSTDLSSTVGSSAPHLPTPRPITCEALCASNALTQVAHLRLSLINIEGSSAPEQCTPNAQDCTRLLRRLPCHGNHT